MKTFILFITVFILSIIINHCQAQWTQKADFGGTGRRGAVGFTIGTKIYIGTGSDEIGLTNDFWEYLPDTDVLFANSTVPYSIKIYPNPTNDIIVIEAPLKTNIQIINSQGTIIESLILSSSKTMLDLSKFSCGVYIFKVKTDKNIVTMKIIKQ